ncbi:hypothetical protein K1719_031464 [Acacia pycnantha]|nr:hypothetical protein K1719_031464 [Acacia pycnantha]
MDATQKKVLVSAPNYQDGALSGIPCTSTNSKTVVTDQYVGLSVIDLLYDDGPKITVEEHPTFEDHVAFSLEGLGKVAAKTPPQSPQQTKRISYSYSQLLKDEKKQKLSKAINHELEDLELEVDTMMQDINAAPISKLLNLSYNRGKRSLVASQEYNHFSDQANKYGSSISQEFFYNSEIKDDDIWNAPSSSFFDEKFENEREYDTSWKTETFQRGTSSPDSLKSGACKARYAFVDQLPKKRSLAASFDRFDPIEFPATARCSRSNGNLIEESCSSTAVRGEAIAHSPSRLSTGEISKENVYAFGSPGTLGSSDGNEDPFGIFTIPESHDKASPSFSGLKSSACVVDSPPRCFTSEKFALGESHVFSDVRSWTTSPNFPPKFASFHCETPAPDLHENAGRDEDMKLEMQQDFEGNSESKEETFMVKNRCSSEKKTVGDSSTSNNHTQDCEVEKDPNLLLTRSLETMEEISSSSMKKLDKNETKVDNTKNNCDAETPLICKIANEDPSLILQSQDLILLSPLDHTTMEELSVLITAFEPRNSRLLPPIHLFLRPCFLQLPSQILSLCYRLLS